MTNPVDQAVQDWLVSHRTRWLTWLAWRVTDLGTTTMVAAATLVVGATAAIRFRSWIPLAACAAAEVAVEVAARTTKLVVGRPRPPDEQALQHLANASLPSAHVARATLLVALAVLFTVPPRWRRPAAGAGAAFVVAMAWSRVYLGAHWLTDNVVAWPFGLAAGLAAARISSRGIRAPDRPAG